MKTNHRTPTTVRSPRRIPIIVAAYPALFASLFAAPTARADVETLPGGTCSPATGVWAIGISNNGATATSISFADDFVQQMSERACTSNQSGYEPWFGAAVKGAGGSF